MAILLEDPDSVIKKYSLEFESSFMGCLKIRHGTKRTLANNVYQEMIADKGHIHMNSTYWPTLTLFCQNLGKKGLCIVSEEERGWYVQLIDRDTAKIQKEKDMKAREDAELRAEERDLRRREKQALEASLLNGGSLENEATKLVRKEGEKVAIKLGGISKVNAGGKRPLNLVANASTLLSNHAEGETGKKKKSRWGEEPQPQSNSITHTSASKTTSGLQQKPSSALDEIMRANEVAKVKAVELANTKKKKFEEEQQLALAAAQSAKSSSSSSSSTSSFAKNEYWLQTGIIVKVTNRSLLDGKYYKSKGVVQSVIDKYGCSLKILDSGDLIQLDQDDLQTVIPKNEGDKVLVCNGIMVGKKARIVKIRKDGENADLEIEGDVHKRISFEDFSTRA